MATSAWISAEKAFINFWWRKDSYCFQFHDSRAAMGATGSKRVFTTSHPSDFIVTHRGVTFYAEVKSCHDAVSFPFSNIKTSQWAAAIQMEAAGGQYFFFIYSTTLLRWHKIEARFLIEAKKKKASIRWTEIQQFEWLPPISST